MHFEPVTKTVTFLVTNLYFGDRFRKWDPLAAHTELFVGLSSIFKFEVEFASCGGAFDRQERGTEVGGLRGQRGLVKEAGTGEGRQWGYPRH